ncbi:metal ABC transporter substrate-binding protein [Candidatus Marinamargulisbacteria bacterium SCGC AG-343-D04]|nr:metal ABC transporter substrate-binding protein [Candidatus Marinamargulisbacteria bacterium SCGC AG-343-D04]
MLWGMFMGGVEQKEAVEGPGKFKAVTTFTVIADIARNIAGDAAIVESITRPGAEIHDYQPTPKDIIRAKGADVIFWNGMNLERWFERFLQDIKDVPSVVISEGVTPLSIYEGPYTGKPNPHAWMSPEVALIYIENIRQTFVNMDPGNAEVYNENAAQYAKQVADIRSELMKTLSMIPEEKRYLVTSEGAFSYLATDLDMKEVYLWPMNADQQGTPQQVRKVIDMVREKHIPVIFSESTISDKPAKQVASETTAIYGGVLYVDSLSEADGVVPTYLDLLKVTTSTIANGFKLALQE